MEDIFCEFCRIDTKKIIRGKQFPYCSKCCVSSSIIKEHAHNVIGRSYKSYLRKIELNERDPGASIYFLRKHCTRLKYDILVHRPHILFLLFYEGIKIAESIKGIGPKFTPHKIKMIEERELEERSALSFNRTSEKPNSIEKNFISYFIPLFETFLDFLERPLQYCHYLTVDHIARLREKAITDNITAKDCFSFTCFSQLNIFFDKVEAQNSLTIKELGDYMHCQQMADGRTIILKKTEHVNPFENRITSTDNKEFTRGVVKKLLDDYNTIAYEFKDLKKEALVKLIQKFAIFHPLANGNGRILYMLLLNIELIKLGEYPSLQVNPNNFECFERDTSTLKKNITKGQERFKEFIQLGYISYGTEFSTKVKVSDLEYQVSRCTPELQNKYRDLCLRYGSCGR
tara:strand:- start:2318 stop:3520 length:1203 start_codon:yes stop_codon:yes gene_type:complete